MRVRGEGSATLRKINKQANQSKPRQIVWPPRRKWASENTHLGRKKNGRRDAREYREKYTLLRVDVTPLLFV